MIGARESLVFDACYEEGLRMDLEEKQEDLCAAIATYLFVNDVLVGEIYGIRVCGLNEEIPDVDEQIPRDAVYCCSTTILPGHRYRGYAKLLKAYWLGRMLSEASLIVGHSTSPEMLRLNNMFGAVHFINPRKNWFGSGRDAWFYKLRL